MPQPSKYADRVITNYEALSDDLTIRAQFIYNALKFQYEHELLDPGHTLSKYMIKQLLLDKNLLNSINSISDINLTIEKLCSRTIILSTNHEELIDNYELILNAINRSDLPNSKKNDLRDFYISTLLLNNYDSISSGKLKISYQENLIRINTSNISKEMQNDLKARYMLQCLTYDKSMRKTIVAEILQDQSLLRHISTTPILSSKLRAAVRGQQSAKSKFEHTLKHYTSSQSHYLDQYLKAQEQSKETKIDSDTEESNIDNPLDRNPTQ